MFTFSITSKKCVQYSFSMIRRGAYSRGHSSMPPRPKQFSDTNWVHVAACLFTVHGSFARCATKIGGSCEVSGRFLKNKHAEHVPEGAPCRLDWSDMRIVWCKLALCHVLTATRAFREAINRIVASAERIVQPANPNLLKRAMSRDYRNNRPSSIVMNGIKIFITGQSYSGKISGRWRIYAGDVPRPVMTGRWTRGENGPGYNIIPWMRCLRNWLIFVDAGYKSFIGRTH